MAYPVGRPIAAAPFSRPPGAVLNRADPLARCVVFDFDPLTFQDATRTTWLTPSGPTRAIERGRTVANFVRGSSQAISLGDPSFFDFGSADFSFEFILTLASPATSAIRMQLLSKDASGGRQLWCEINTQASAATDNSIALVWINGSTAQQRSPVNSLVVGQRQHIVCQRVGSSVEFYFDGVRVATTAGVGHTGFPAVAASSTTAHLGRRAYSGFEEYFDGSIELARVRNVALSAQQVRRLYESPYSLYEIPARIWVPTASGSPYSLTAEAGSFSETGQAAGLTATRTIAGAAGSFTEIGQAAGLTATRTIAGGTGAFTETGQDAALIYTPAGAYTLSAAAGSFSETGQDAALLHATLMAAAPGSFAFTGNAASLVYTPAGSYSLTAAAGSFAMTGRDAALAYSGATGPEYDPRFQIKYPSGGFSVAMPRNAWTIKP